MAHCKRCGAAVVWGKRAGKRPYEPGAFVMLEPEPSPHGIHPIVDGRVVPDSDAPKETPRYLPHELTCEHGRKRERQSPFADDHEAAP